MALKKSELYSSLWQSCDELRGGMDASQYKDCVLSGKYAGQPHAPITIPPGANFKDMVALKGKSDIGLAAQKADSPHHVYGLVHVAGALLFVPGSLLTEMARRQAGTIADRRRTGYWSSGGDA